MQYIFIYKVINGYRNATQYYFILTLPVWYTKV